MIVTFKSQMIEGDIMATYNTMQRTVILSFLKTNMGQAFTVKEMIAGIRADSSTGISLPESTVYRIMGNLVKSGIAKRDINRNREYQYRLSDDKKGRVIVRCRICGKVQQIDEGVCREMINELKDHGSMGTDGDIEILVICDDCK